MSTHPTGPVAADAQTLSAEDRATLLRYARDTWHSFELMTPAGRLTSDTLIFLPDQPPWPTPKTTPTDIAAYLWSTIAAEELGLIDAGESRSRIELTLEALQRAERVHGLFFDRICTTDSATLRSSTRTGEPIRPLLSSVDNAWLAVALILVRNRSAILRGRADGLLREMDLGIFHVPYDSDDPLARPGQIRGVYYPDEVRFEAFFHGLINSETRIATYVAIARGAVPPEHYYRIFRTMPPSLGAQFQEPEGTTANHHGVDVFEGHYTYRGMRIVPSWGGSMFEALMVTLFVPESRWAPSSWGVNHPLYVRAQIEHGMDEANYGFWGFSPCFRPEGDYKTYGVNATGSAPDGYFSHERAVGPDGTVVDPPSVEGVVTPHASFLALPYYPIEAMANLAALERQFPIYGPCGFRDSVNVKTGRVADRVLSLDQGMIMAAIANILRDDVIQRTFCEGEIEAAIRPLIAPEVFSAGQGPAS